MYKNDFYEIKNSDMAKVSLVSSFGGIVIIKNPFLRKRLKRFKIKPIIKNGELKELKILAPYGMVIEFLEMINYKPLISENYCVESCGRVYKYIYKEEWYNPHYPIYGELKQNTFGINDELPF